MVATDEDAILCDFAQYYHIYDYRQYPLGYVAILGVGLPYESRSVRKATGREFDAKTMLLANIVDYLALEVWMQSKDGHKKRNRPKSVTKALLEKKEESKIRGFNSAEEFERERARILKEVM